MRVGVAFRMRIKGGVLAISNKICDNNFQFSQIKYSENTSLMALILREDTEQAK